jgi:DUF1365 family protein
MECQASSRQDIKQKLESCLYIGTIRHRRFLPIKHEFNYKIFMYFINLDEVNKYFKTTLLHNTKFSLIWFRKKDFLSKQKISKEIKNRFNSQFVGEVFLLTYVRTFGFNFNPVNFYYCYENGSLKYIVSQITNTPWLEKHIYAFEVPSDQKLLYRFNKEFHVSPFLPMKMKYEWFFTSPNDVTHVHMNNFKDGDKYFDATLKLNKVEINKINLIKTHLRYPLLPMIVKIRIYFNALILMLKGAVFYTHPSKLKKG